MKKTTVILQSFITLGLMLIVGIITTIGCKSNTQTESDEKKIRERTQGWIDVAEKGDAEGYFDFITDDFFYMFH